MNQQEMDNVKRAMNANVVRRLMIRYFVEKGFSNSFDRALHPTLLQDLTMRCQPLASKVEVVPHAVEVNPSLGRATLGWNLFVLGNHRMYLGETIHSDLIGLAQQLRAGATAVRPTLSTCRRQSTPRRVVNFVVRVLGEHDSGYVDLTPSVRPAGDEPFKYRGAMMSIPQQSFNRG